MSYLMALLSLFSFFPSRASAHEKVALVFDGGSIDKDSKLNLVHIAEKRGFSIRYVKPGESTPRALKQAAVYIVAGGEDITKPSEGWTANDLTAIRNYVRGGGKYWGVCLGGYWIGKEGTWPSTKPYFHGLDLIPAVVRAHSVTAEDRIEKIKWHDGQDHFAYFQDGPHFEFSPEALKDPRNQIFGYYQDGTVAAFEAKVGQGRVMISGVHWEATPDWYKDIADRLHPGKTYDLVDPEPAHERFAFEMFDALMRD